MNDQYNAASEEIVPVNIRIMDRDYQIACPRGEQEPLNKAARHVSEQMKEVRGAARTASNEQIAVMAALNIAHELLNGKPREGAVDLEMAARIERLAQRAESALQSYQQLAI